MRAHGRPGGGIPPLHRSGRRTCGHALAWARPPRGRTGARVFRQPGGGARTLFPGAHLDRVADIDFACAAVESLPFAHGTFDAGIFGGALHWTSEPDRALVEIARVSKPGAPLAGYTVARGQKSDIGRKIAGRGGHLFAEPGLGASLECAGFDRVELETIGELLVFQAARRVECQDERGRQPAV